MTILNILDLLALSSAALLTGLAMVSDVRHYLIPNQYCFGILLCGLAFGLSHTPEFPWVSHLGAAVLVFLGGALLFNLGLFGGGDVKLLTALSFWAGLEQVLPFLLLVVLLGGVLSLSAVLIYWLTAFRRDKTSAEPRMAGLTLLAAMHTPSVAEATQTAKTFQKFGFMKLRVPYGIAIALGSVYVFAIIIRQLNITAG